MHSRALVFEKRSRNSQIRIEQLPKHKPKLKEMSFTLKQLALFFLAQTALGPRLPQKYLYSMT